MVGLLQIYVLISLLFILIKCNPRDELQVRKTDQKLIERQRQDTRDMCKIFNSEAQKAGFPTTPLPLNKYDTRKKELKLKQKKEVIQNKKTRRRRFKRELNSVNPALNVEDELRVESVVEKIYDDLLEKGQKIAYRRKEIPISKATQRKKSYTPAVKSGRRFPFAPIKMDAEVIMTPRADTVIEELAGSKPVRFGNAIVPYFIDAKTYDIHLAETIMRAFDYFEKATCIRLQRLRERPIDPQSLQNVTWLYISNPSGIRQCVHSNEKVEIQGVQHITFGYDCMSLGDISHEIMHVLGFAHEHVRPDRDQHITILWENIKPGYKQYFEIRNESIVEGLPYDYASVMHYPPRAFSRNGKPTILTERAIKIGQREALSERDLEKISIVYSNECIKRNREYLMKTCPTAVKAEVPSTKIFPHDINVYFKERLWPYGVVTYKFDTNMIFSFEEKENIKAVMNHISNQTCVQFVDLNQNEALDDRDDEDVSSSSNHFNTAELDNLVILSPSDTNDDEDDTTDNDFERKETKDNDSDGKETEDYDFEGKETTDNDSEGKDDRDDEDVSSSSNHFNTAELDNLVILSPSDTNDDEDDTTDNDFERKETKDNDSDGKETEDYDFEGKETTDNDSECKEAKGFDFESKETTDNDSGGKDTQDFDFEGKDTTDNDSECKEAKGFDFEGKETTDNDSECKEAKGSDFEGKETTDNDSGGKDTQNFDFEGKDNTDNDSECKETQDDNFEGKETKGNHEVNEGFIPDTSTSIEAEPSLRYKINSSRIGDNNRTARKGVKAKDKKCAKGNFVKRNNPKYNIKGKVANIGANGNNINRKCAKDKNDAKGKFVKRNNAKKDIKGKNANIGANGNKTYGKYAKDKNDAKGKFVKRNNAKKDIKGKNANIGANGNKTYGIYAKDKNGAKGNFVKRNNAKYNIKGKTANVGANGNNANGKHANVDGKVKTTTATRKKTVRRRKTAMPPTPTRRHVGSILVLSRSDKPGCPCPHTGKPKDGSNPTLLINTDCFNTVNDLLHLFGHVLGLDHQHNMHDRESYLHIQWDQLTEDVREEMKTLLPPAASVGYPYDYHSVMHYPWLQIKNGKTNMMYPIWNDGWAMGHWQGLSAIDVEKIQHIYNQGCLDRMDLENEQKDDKDGKDDKDETDKIDKNGEQDEIDENGEQDESDENGEFFNPLIL